MKSYFMLVASNWPWLILPPLLWKSSTFSSIIARLSFICPVGCPSKILTSQMLTKQQPDSDFTWKGNGTAKPQSQFIDGWKLDKKFYMLYVLSDSTILSWSGFLCPDNRTILLYLFVNFKTHILIIWHKIYPIGCKLREKLAFRN